MKTKIGVGLMVLTVLMGSGLILRNVLAANTPATSPPIQTCTGVGGCKCGNKDVASCRANSGCQKTNPTCGCAKK